MPRLPVTILEAHAHRPTGSGLDILVILREDGRRVGLLRLILPPGLHWSHTAYGGLPRRVELDVAFVAPLDTRDLRLPIALIWRDDPEVAAYP